MSLKFALFKNRLVKDTNAYRAIVQEQKSIDLAQLIDEMVAEGTGLTRPQALAYCEKLFSLCEHYVLQGYRAKTLQSGILDVEFNRSMNRCITMHLYGA